MLDIRNPARSRPLSNNVKRLMKLARMDDANPRVEAIRRASICTFAPGVLSSGYLLS